MSVITEERLDAAEKEADKLWAETYPDPDALHEGEVVAKDGKPVETDVVEDGNANADGVDGTLVVEAKPAEVVPPKSDEEIYKQRFQIMEGKYKAEVPRLSAELAQWKDYANGLLARITALEESVKAKPSTPAMEDEGDYEVDSFVQDNPGAAKLFKKLEAQHKAELDVLRNEIKSVDQKATSVKSEFKQSTAMDHFEKEMTNEGVPDWRTVDTSPDFIEWLNRNPYNIKVLQAAASELDAKTVSSFFLDYKKSLNSDNGNGGLPPENGDGEPSKLEKHLSPPRSGGGGPPPRQPVQPVLTTENYTKFMKQTTVGKYNPALWGGKTEAQMEAIFDAAIAKNELR